MGNYTTSVPSEGFFTSPKPSGNMAPSTRKGYEKVTSPQKSDNREKERISVTPRKAKQSSGKAADATKLKDPAELSTAPKVPQSPHHVPIDRMASHFSSEQDGLDLWFVLLALMGMALAGIIGYIVTDQEHASFFKTMADQPSSVHDEYLKMGSDDL